MLDYFNSLWMQTPSMTQLRELAQLSIDQLSEYFQQSELPLNLNNSALNIALNPYVIGSAVIGTGIYFTARHLGAFQSKSKLKVLNELIKNKNTQGALDLIQGMRAEELNQSDAEGMTPLYLALKHSSKVTQALIKKFFEENIAVNTTTPHKKSIFSHPLLAKRLLGTVCSPYKEYACLDVKRFLGNIHPSADRDKILSRTAVNDKATQAMVIQPLQGKISRQAIAQCSKLVDESKGGVCTTFALAAADKLLTLFPSERLEIIAHKGGLAGSHVFIVLNRKGEQWSFNDKQQIADIPRAENPKFITELIDEWEDTIIVDPWLASLGWEEGIFSFLDYLNTANVGFLLNTERFYEHKPSTVKVGMRNS